MNDKEPAVADKETQQPHKVDKARVAAEERRRAIKEAQRVPERFNRYLEWARGHRCRVCDQIALIVTMDNCYGGPTEHRIVVTCPATWPWEPRSCYVDELAGVIRPDGTGIVDAEVLEQWEIYISDEPRSWYYLDAVGGGWGPSGRLPVQLPEWLTVAEPGTLEEQVEELLAAARGRHEPG